jgi:hypothetical protein
LRAEEGGLCACQRILVDRVKLEIMMTQTYAVSTMLFFGKNNIAGFRIRAQK